MIFFLGIITVFSDKGILGICSFLERGIEVQVIGGEGMRGVLMLTMTIFIAACVKVVMDRSS